MVRQTAKASKPQVINIPHRANAKRRCKTKNFTVKRIGTTDRRRGGATGTQAYAVIPQRLLLHPPACRQGTHRATRESNAAANPLISDAFVSKEHFFVLYK